MTVPFLSIIIPVYNKEKYLNRCLKSIVNQTFKDFEILIINDGSKDKSIDVIKQYVAVDDRVKFYEQRNQGVSAARNKGIVEARGQWLLFVDADDYVESTYFYNIVEKVSSFRADLYLWGIRFEHSDSVSECVNPTREGLFDRKNFLRGFIPEHYVRTKGLLGFVANKLVRRDIVLNQSLKFSTKLRLMEDYDFFLSYYSVIENVYVFHNNDYHYVDDAVGNSIKSVKDVDYKSLIQVNLKCEELMNVNGVLDDKTKKIIYDNSKLLAEASFLEMHYPTRKLLMGLRKEMSDLGVDTNSLHKRRRLLNLFLHDKTMTLSTIYLKLWRKYLQLRNL